MSELGRTPLVSREPLHHTRVAEAEKDNSALEREAEELGLAPEPISILPAEPQISDEDLAKIKERQALQRELLRQARERLNARGGNFTIRNKRLGRTVTTWLTTQTLDILGKLSCDWECSRTAVITQLVRQAEGTMIKKWIGPAEGEPEPEPKMKKPEENLTLAKRKL